MNFFSEQQVSHWCSYSPCAVFTQVIFFLQLIKLCHWGGLPWKKVLAVSWLHAASLQCSVLVTCSRKTRSGDQIKQLFSFPLLYLRQTQFNLPVTAENTINKGATLEQWAASFLTCTRKAVKLVPWTEILLSPPHGGSAWICPFWIGAILFGGSWMASRCASLDINGYH